MAFKRTPNTIPSPIPHDYDRQRSFTDHEAGNPNAPRPGTWLDNEFDEVERALDETQDRLALIQRDDGALQNASVGFDQLKESARTSIGLYSRVYADAAAGVAATADGDYFSVEATGLDEYLELYRNDAEAAVLIDTYPNRRGAADAIAAATAEADRAEQAVIDGTATAQQLATAQADRSESEASRAEAARDAAQLSAGIYADTAAGLAATVAGDYFSTPSSVSSEFLTLYRHDTGPVATEIEAYPSANAVSATRETAMDALRDARAVFGGEISLALAGSFSEDGFLEVDGSFTPSAAGYKTTKFIPARPGDALEYNAYAGKTPLAFYDNANSFIQAEPALVGGGPMTATAPAGTAFVRMSNDATQVPAPYADALFADSVTPKIESYSYIPYSDLTIVQSSNLAKPSRVIRGQYIDSQGRIKTAAGWVMFKIPVTAGSSYTFGNFAIDTSGYSAFYDDAGNVIQYSGAYTTAGLPLTVAAPAASAYLYIDVARPTNADADWSETIVNEGSQLLAYEDPAGTITELRDDKFAGSTDFTGVARLGEDANFNRLEAAELHVSTLIANLPSGTTLPAGVELNQAWIDETDGAIKVRLV